MRAGKLRWSVTVQRPTTTVDAVGDPVPGYADIATVNASYEPIGGIEPTNSGQVVPVALVRVTMRGILAFDGTPLVDETCRVVFPFVTLEIESVQDFEGIGKMLVLICKKAAP